MSDKDIGLAKSLLTQDVTCVAVKGERSLTSRFSGIRPMMQWIGEQEDLSGYAVADKVVGKAAALLMVYLGVGEVYAQVLSEAGKRTLDLAGIPVSYGSLCDRIVNRRGDDICPMEKTVLDIDDPQIALEALRRKVAEMQKAR